MASSGTLLGSNRQVGSYASSYARIRVEWQLASQSTPSNYSRINWQAYVDFIQCDAQLDNGQVSSNTGALYSNGGRVYNYTGNFANHTITLGSGAFNVGHNGSGVGSLSLSASVAIFQSGTSSGSQSWSLPTIPRNATITSLTADQVTDSGFRFNWTSSDNVNLVSWKSAQTGSGDWANVAASGTGPFRVTLSDLISEKTYAIYVRVRRADSNLWTDTGPLNITTLKQNNFFGMRIP